MAKKEMKSNNEKKHFWKEFKAELKKVIWPTPKQLLNNTSVVIALVIIIALIVFVLDLCFDSINKYGITKLQTIVQSSVQEEKNSEEENSSEEETDSEDTNTSEEQSTENDNSTETENVDNQETTE